MAFSQSRSYFKIYLIVLALPSITMAYLISHLWWYQLSSSFASPDLFLGVIGSGFVETTMVQSPSTNWQILPSDVVAIYYIRNEAAGPHFQLGLSSQYSTADHEPQMVSINLSSTQQHWALDLHGDGVQIRNIALGELGVLNVSRDGTEPLFGAVGDLEEIETWNIKPIKMIDDASFLTSSQTSFMPSVRGVPNDTSSTDPAAAHYIPVGPPAAGVTLALALIFGVVLWRYSPMRRKHLQHQSQVELGVVDCVPEEAAPDTQEPLPQYHTPSCHDNQPPPPDYNSTRSEENNLQMDGTPPEYSRQAVG